ncbi:MAG TPA: hypothetical protein VK464_03975 [Symbiobacteriaceae bacterium]|nr:hypothetical protein [Symbiobacteriaceae bacterium]
MLVILCREAPSHTCSATALLALVSRGVVSVQEDAGGVWVFARHDAPDLSPPEAGALDLLFPDGRRTATTAEWQGGANRARRAQLDAWWGQVVLGFAQRRVTDEGYRQLAGWKAEHKQWRKRVDMARMPLAVAMGLNARGLVDPTEAMELDLDWMDDTFLLMNAYWAAPASSSDGGSSGGGGGGDGGGGGVAE